MPADPLATLNQRALDAMRAALGDDLPADADPTLTPSRNPEFGDFQCMAAMRLGKTLKRNPRELAEEIVRHLDLEDIAHPPEVAGPGFINIRLRTDALQTALHAMDDDALGVEPPATPETVVVDLCGVNLAKQMHVGHLRATVIGDALARIHERLGHHVIRQNHFGDWGLPIAMVTQRIKTALDAGQITPDDITPASLEHHYRAAQQACSPDRRGLAAVERFGLGPKAEAELQEQVAGAEQALDHAKQALLALQRGDADYARTWKLISDVTLAACFDNCRRLHANVTNEHTAGESTYRDELAPLVQDLASRGVAEESEGALVVRLEDFGIKEPCLVRKSDGGFLYATTDIAGIRRRVQKLGAHRVIYAVDARQSLHFRQVFAAAHKAGYTNHPDGSTAELAHAAFGTVLGEDSKPLKTRSGENVKLADLLDEAVARADAAVAERNPDLPDDERRAISEAVGISAIKYADLSSDRIKDYVFSFDRMLAFEGNTGPYLLYALVRIRSIFRRAQEEHAIDPASLDAPPSPDAPTFALEEPRERAIALELLKYPAVLRAAADTCEPHRLCTYLFELATAFSAFFAACPVLQAPDETTRLGRLRLCRLTGNVLRSGLDTLGLTPLQRM